MSETEIEDLNIDSLNSVFNKAEVEELLKSFVAQTENTLLEIDKAQSSQNFESLRMQAHKLKGVAATMCAMQMAQFSSKLEKDISAGNIVAADEIINNLKKSFIRVKKKINALTEA